MAPTDFQLTWHSTCCGVGSKCLVQTSNRWSLKRILVHVLILTLIIYTLLSAWRWLVLPSPGIGYPQLTHQTAKPAENNSLQQQQLQQQQQQQQHHQQQQQRTTPPGSASLSMLASSAANPAPSEDQPQRSCDVLADMVRGRWVPRAHGREEGAQLDLFIQMSRAQHNLPSSLQRPDGKCGNVTFAHLAGKMHNLLWFRALCDPHGLTPCCLHNQCTGNVSTNDCRCPDCYDMRQPIHAEFATWQPADPTCEVEAFNKTKTCEGLGNMTILMIGDSFMRHVHTAMLTLLRNDSQFGPLRRNSTNAQLAVCGEDFIYQQSCAITLDKDARECNNRVHLKFLEYIAARQTLTIQSAIQQLSGSPNSFVLIGIGIHDDFNFNFIAPMLLQPLINMASISRWPEIVWMSTHAPGLLKTPRVPSQSAESIRLYNDKVKMVLQRSGSRIPILDFYNLTMDAVSFDGAHYGRGVNLVKAQIFLSYILERKKRIEELVPR